MVEQIQAIRGMRDILPDKSPIWQKLEQCIRDILQTYGYQEIRMPVIEKTELFKRSIGESTDIVSKEMYTFSDRNGELLTLRPEGTASCVRLGLENGLFHNPAQRLWYSGPMFRHERPQKGRLRQFNQIGVEAFGMNGPDIDAELIIMCKRIWANLGLDKLKLEINSLGSSVARLTYREILIEYFKDSQDQLDDDSKKKLHLNPLRILDSKNPEMQDLISKAPTITDTLDNESADHFAGVQSLLAELQIKYTVNPRLVRGLDYYNRTVFEFITEELGAQGTICAGGRYDGLVEQFGGKPTSAIGFAMGLERLVSLIESDNHHTNSEGVHIYFIVALEKAMPNALILSEQLRDNLAGLKLIVHCGGGSFKSQFRRADNSGAKLALILGEEELEQKTVGIKPLRQDQEQIMAQWSNIVDIVREQLDS